MARPKAIPSTLDTKKLYEMTLPLKVSLHRLRAGSPSEVIPLPNNGNDWTPEKVQGLDGGVPGVAGGGSFHAIVNDSKGDMVDWKFFVPGREVVPAETQIEIAQAFQRTQAASGQLSQQPVTSSPIPPWMQTQPVNPWGQQQQQVPPQMPQMGASQNPWAPPQSPPQFVGQQQYGAPTYQQPVFGGTTPYGGGQFPQQQFGGPPQWWQQQSPQGYGASPGWGPPPQILPPPVPANTGIDQKVAILEQQNMQLREDRIRREQSESVQALTSELKTLAQSTNSRFEQLLASLQNQQNQQNQKPADDGALRTELLRLEQDRKTELLRFEQQRRDDQLAFQRQLDQQQQAAREREDRMMRELSDSKSRSEQSQTLAMFQAMQQANTTIQQESVRAQKDTVNMLSPHILTPEKLITVIKESKDANPNDSLTHKLAENFITMAMDGGQGGGWPQAASQIAGALLDGAGKVTGAVLEGKSAEAKMKMLAESRAQQQLAQVAQRRQQQVQQPPQQLGGAVAAPQQNGQVRSTPQPKQPIVVDGPLGDAQAILESEERAYFGAAYEPVIQIRQAVDAGILSTPDKIVDAIAGGYQYFVIGMGMELPFLDDLDPEEGKTGDIEKFVRRVLPDAPGPLRFEIAKLLPEKLDGLKEAAEEERARMETDTKEAQAQYQAQQEVPHEVQNGNVSAMAGLPISESALA